MSSVRKKEGHKAEHTTSNKGQLWHQPCSWRYHKHYSPAVSRHINLLPVWKETTLHTSRWQYSDFIQKGKSKRLLLASSQHCQYFSLNFWNLFCSQKWSVLGENVWDYFKGIVVVGLVWLLRFVAGWFLCFENNLGSESTEQNIDNIYQCDILGGTVCVLAFVLETIAIHGYTAARLIV